MAQLIIAENKGIQSVTYTLPNKHYVPVDMRYLSVENMQPSVNFHLRHSSVSFCQLCSFLLVHQLHSAFVVVIFLVYILILFHSYRSQAEVFTPLSAPRSAFAPGTSIQD
jgi:hypothetical protein